MTGGDYRGPDSFSVGSEVAGYRLEEQIGRGGMAVVFRARDVQLGRNVALKLLAPVLALDDAFRQRFIRESRAAAAVDHPHIIPIFAAGESDGVLFIAMRYVQGGDVRTLLDNAGALPAGRGADIITQVALALDAAHLHGLVHRDIKLANMLLDSVSDGAQRDHVYLADFGLSKRSLSVTGLTSIGQFLGTPAYVAPEQVEGRPVDGRADLYALACASFEILSGAPPYERDDDLAVMWAHVSAPPPSLSARRPDLPAEIDGVLARAMAKAPADRYPTCLDFALALRRALGLQVQPPDLVPPAGGPGPPEPPGPPRPGAHPPTEISMPRGRPDARPDRGAAAEPYGAPPGTAGPAPEHFGRPGSHGPPPPPGASPARPPPSPLALRTSLLPPRSPLAPVRVRWNPVRVRWNPVRVRWTPVRVRWNPVRQPAGPPYESAGPLRRACWTPVRARWNPVRACWTPVRARWNPLRAPDRGGVASAAPAHRPAAGRAGRLRRERQRLRRERRLPARAGVPRYAPAPAARGREFAEAVAVVASRRHRRRLRGRGRDRHRGGGRAAR